MFRLWRTIKSYISIDHKIDLQFGGDNSVENLAALCNNCHAEKTAANNL